MENIYNLEFYCCSDVSALFSSTVQEFKFLEQSRSPSVSPSKQPASTSSKTVTLFEQYCHGGNPFEVQANHRDDETEDVLASNGVSRVLGACCEPHVLDAVGKDNLPHAFACLPPAFLRLH